jgi:hypothetical protein
LFSVLREQAAFGVPLAQPDHVVIHFTELSRRLAQSSGG